MIAAPLDERARRLHKLRNRAQSALLLGGMAALLAACGWALAGPDGVLWALLAGGISLVFTPRLSPRIALGLYGARPIRPAELPEVVHLLARIAARAGLPQPPLRAPAHVSPRDGLRPGARPCASRPHALARPVVRRAKTRRTRATTADH